MKDFQRMYKKLNVAQDTSERLYIPPVDVFNNKFTFVFYNLTLTDVPSYVKIYIEAGSPDAKVNLTEFEDLFIESSNSSILRTDFPIVSGIEVIVNNFSRGTISIGIHAGNF